MKKPNKTKKSEHIEVWDAGTYQTGSVTPPKNANPLVAFLLMLVIFLGGIASALGLVNMQLLIALQQTQPDPTVPLKIQSNLAPIGEILEDDALPQLPQGQVTMNLMDPNLQMAEEVSNTAYLARVENVSVTVSGSEDLSGPGLVFSSNGYILTYAHLLEQDRIYVTLADGSRHRASFVGSDPLTDMAVIYIDAYGLHTANFSDQAQGHRVWYSRENALSSGAICRELCQFSLGSTQLRLLQTSAAANRESGALWNSDCQVVGILSPAMAQFLGDDEQDLAWVIPSSAIKEIVDHILCCGHVPGRPTLDIDTETVTDLYRNYWHLPTGLRITDSDHPVLQDGDILVQLQGKELTCLQDLNAILFSAQPGDKMDAAVIRNGKVINLSVTILEDECDED